MVVGVLSTLLTVVLILYPLYQFEILRIPRFLPMPILTLMVIAASTNVALIGLLGILVTHRLAGPMFSLVKHFRLIEEGSWDCQIRLRDGDDMRYVVRNFNGMMASIKKRTESDLEILKDIKSVANEDGLDIADKLKKISAITNELEFHLSTRLTASDINKTVS